MKKTNKTRLEYLVAAVLVAGIVIALNVLVQFIHLRFDFTQDKEFTLSPSTQKILGQLEDQLTIKLYYSKNLPGQLLPIQQRVADTLEEMKAAAKHPVIIKEMDPDSTEDKEKETLSFGLLPIQLNVIEKDRQEVKKVYMGLELGYRDRSAVIPALTQVDNFEYQVALNILKFTQTEPSRIGLFVGNDAERYQVLPELIKQLGTVVPIKADDQNLDEKKLAALIVVNPVDLNTTFIKPWDALLDEGTSLVIFAGMIDVDQKMVATPVSTGIDEWLATKAVGINGALLVDPMQNAQAVFRTNFGYAQLGYPFWVRTIKGDLNRENPITAQLEEIIFPWANTVQLLNDEQNPWQAAVLVKSSLRSFLQPEPEPNIDPYYVSSLQQLPVFESYPLSVLLEKKEEGEEKKATGRIILTATPHLVRDDILQRQQSNVVFLENIFEYATWGDDLICIRSRGQTARPLKATSVAQRAAIKWGLMFGVPAITILFGILSLWFLKRRRNLWITKLPQ
jgi:ABC-type uncharacterized transport system involved in gliding motility auxiliary subunit